MLLSLCSNQPHDASALVSIDLLGPDKSDVTIQQGHVGLPERSQSLMMLQHLSHDPYRTLGESRGPSALVLWSAKRVLRVAGCLSRSHMRLPERQESHVMLLQASRESFFLRYHESRKMGALDYRHRSRRKIGFMVWCAGADACSILQTQRGGRLSCTYCTYSTCTFSSSRWCASCRDDVTMWEKSVKIWELRKHGQARTYGTPCVRTLKGCREGGQGLCFHVILGSHVQPSRLAETAPGTQPPQ